MGKSEKSHGAYKFDNSQDAQKSIQNTIQNDGAFIPSALKMIQNLRAVTNGQNPTAIQSVGAGNFASALSAISAMFNQSKSSSNNAANTDPCSIPVEQRTPQQQYDCEVQTSLAMALANTGNTQTDDTSNDGATDDALIAEQLANTAGYTQAVIDVSNTILVPVTNSIVSNVTTINTIATSVESFIMADSVAVNTLANATSNDVVTIIIANTTQVNTIANSIVQSIIATPTLANNVANSIQTPIALDLLANATFISQLKTALGI